MWVGIDDTDSLHGGCTTYVATEIVKEICNIGYDIIGYPRLVRLNPNIPWKTRGNGAIALQIGIGEGKRKLIGEIEEKVYGYSYKKKEVEEDEIISILDKIMRNAEKEANPAWVVAKKKFSRKLYSRAVKEIVPVKEVKKLLAKKKANWKTYRKEMGIIGASAAIAWKPADRTYELITYTHGEKFIEKESVIEMDLSFPSTFNNYDYENDYIALLPHSPSPVFYGIRGDNVEELKKAMKMLKTSEVERWIIYETNQATDDHLQRKKIEEVKPYESVIVRGMVKKEPFVIEGGHVIFSITDGREIECTAYEPTKGFRNIVKELKKGDEIVVYGGVRARPFTINIEKIEVKKLVDVYKKIENPICKKCRKHMKSMGKGKGYKCPKCGAKAEESEAKYVKIDRKIKPSFYEVPVIARRHLAKPLKRMNIR